MYNQRHCAVTKSGDPRISALAYEFVILEARYHWHTLDAAMCKGSFCELANHISGRVHTQ